MRSTTFSAWTANTLVVFGLLTGAPVVSQTPESNDALPGRIRLIGVEKIWDAAPHSAFTDLAYWHDEFICAFREGRGHVSRDGRIRVLASTDGTKWHSVATVEMAGFDLRDAGLSITPDGRSMLIGGAAPRKADGELVPTGSFVSFSDDARRWSPPQIIVKPGRWLWRVTWYDGSAYGVAYASSKGHRFSALMSTKDGIHYRELVPRMLDMGHPTEATIRFGEDSVAYCLQRRDGSAPANSAMLGSSKPPYLEWQWADLKLYFGGPNFIQLPSGRWIAAGRIQHPHGPKTELAWLDVEQKTLTPCLTLPSGGDTSYPGLVWHNGQLWVSYYSSHEGRTSVYLARVSIE
jgi:hypothetical protein